MDLLVDRERGDLVFTNGLTLTTSDEANVVAQRIYIHLRTFKGEWFMDTPYGVPWFEIFGKKNITKSYIDRILQEEVYRVEGVREIGVWESSINLQKRNYEVSFTVRTTNGMTTDTIDSDSDWMYRGIDNDYDPENPNGGQVRGIILSKIADNQLSNENDGLYSKPLMWGRSEW